MGIKTRRLLATPDYKKHLVLLLIVQGVMLMLTGTFTILLTAGIINASDERLYAAIGKLHRFGPEVRNGLISAVTKNIEADAADLGRKIAGDFGYGKKLSLQRKALYGEMRPVLIGGLAAVFFTGIAAHVFLYITRQRKIYTKIDSLSREIGEILDGTKRNTRDIHEEGLWGQLVYRFNQMVKKLQSASEHLEKERMFLQNTLSDISHQIKTPLASLIMYNDLMINDPGMDEETRMEFLEQSGKQLRRTEWLVKNLLLLARLEAGTVRYRFERVDLREVIGLAKENVHALTAARGIQIMETGMEPLFVIGDCKWLTEAVTNVLKNAVQHTREGSRVTITAASSPLFSRITIADNGPGMSETDLPRIFQRFYRGTRSTDTESAGIGLSLAKMIMDLHNGDLRARNGEKGGAEFIFTFSN